MIRAILAVYLTHITTAAVSAGALYTTYAKSRDDLTSVLSTIDPTTGQVPVVEETTADKVTGLTWDPTTNALYGIGRTSDQLFGTFLRINPVTGATTHLADTAIRQPGAMTWVPTLGRFVVTSTEPSGSTFYAVDHGGAMEMIGQIDALVLGMTYEPKGDRILFTTPESFGGHTGLGEFDVQTGAASVFGLNGAHLQGIALDPDTGVLYGLPDLTETPGGGGRTLFTVDMETGVATAIATLEREEFYASLAVIPVPAPAAALVFLPLAVRRRR